MQAKAKIAENPTKLTLDTKDKTMATKAKRHVHKYHKISVRFADLWACGSPLCSHYIPEHQSELVNGKASICWGCGEMFILNPTNMKNRKPQCDDCALGLNSLPEPSLKDALDEKRKESEPVDEEKSITAESILNFIRSQLFRD